MGYDGNMTDDVSKRVVYSSQSQDLRAKNNYLTSGASQTKRYRCGWKDCCTSSEWAWPELSKPGYSDEVYAPGL